MTQREIFLKHVAQTSPTPLALEIVKAEGALLFDRENKEYIDLIGGISVANVGHRHPKVVQAIRDQVDAYLHIMVYGEFIETPQVRYASLLAQNLPSSLNSIYFTNSGTEAVEGAMKLAKRFTGKTEMIAFHNSYHGSTQGALSIMGDENWRNAFRPLLPGITHLQYNSRETIDAITEQTACVILETIQGEAGVIAPDMQWLHDLRDQCSKKGCLLIMDEIQTAFGRTGTLWGFEHFNIIPDILLLGKALGGGMPLGAFIADREMMSSLISDPVLGHITTFGGHPVCCAAGFAAMSALIDEKIMDDVPRKESLFRSLLVHPGIRTVRSKGLWLAVEFDSFETNKKIIDYCIEQGVLADWFLFAPQCLRISPPLVISEDQITKAAGIIIAACNSV